MQLLPIRKLLLVSCVIAGPLRSEVTAEMRIVRASFRPISRHGARRLPWILLLVLGVFFGSRALGQIAHVNGDQSTIAFAMNDSSGVGAREGGNGQIAETGNRHVSRQALPAGNLGSVNVGSSSTTPLSVTLTIGTAGMLSSIAVVTQGAAGLDFTNAGGGTCTVGTAYSVANTCTVNVTFKPRFAGARYGAAVLKDGSGNVLATGYLQGTGVGPQIAFSPSLSIATALPTVNGEVLNDIGGMAVDGAGNLFIGAYPSVVEVPAGGGAAIVINPTVNDVGLNRPYGEAVDGAGNLFINDQGNNRVVEVPAGGGAAIAIDPIVDGLGLDDPFALAVDGAGDLFVADLNNNRVVEIPTGGGAATAIVGLSQPFSVTVDGAGDLFIASDGYRYNALVEVPAGGGAAIPVTPTAIVGEGITAIAVDGVGDLLIAYNGADVMKVPVGGGTPIVISPPGLTVGYVMAVDGAGDLFIPAPNNQVIELQRSLPAAISFATIPAGGTADSPRTITLDNFGNAPLTFPIPGPGDNQTIAPNFTIDTSVTPFCPLVDSTSPEPGTLAAGSDCLLPVTFTPTAAGMFTAALTFTDNNLNAAAPDYPTQTIQFSGTSATPVPASLSSPVSGSTLAGPAVTFSWTPGTDVSEYQFFLGTTGVGSSNLYNSGYITAGYFASTSAEPIDIPLVGRTVYARLSSMINGVWQSTDYTYTEALAVAILISPTPVSVLGTSNLAFSWTTGIGVAEYVLYLGTTPGSTELFRSTRLMTTSVTVPTLPSSGATVYATLFSEINGVWQSTTATYTESPGAPATILLPSSGTVLGTSNIPFSWTTGTGVALYELYLGNSPGSADLFRSTRLATPSVTVPSLPSSGATVYATLWSEIGGVRQSTTTTYTESPGAPATILSPVSGSVLGTSNIAFSWTTGTGVALYELYLGNSPGSADFFRSTRLATTSVTVPTLPSGGATVYATLWSEINGVRQSTTAIYTEQP